MKTRLAARRWKRRGGGYSRMAVGVVVLALSGCSQTTDEVFYSFDSVDIDEIHVNSQDSTAEITGVEHGTEVRVIATRTWSLRRPVVSAETTDGQLRLSHDCRNQRACDVHYIVFIPEELDVSVVSDSGPVLVTQVTGSLDVRTIWGDVFGSALRSSEAEVRTELGDVTLAFEAAPERVYVETVEGRADIVLPVDEDYLLDLNSSQGETSIADLTSEDDADRSVVVVSESGDIAVRGISPVMRPDDEEEEEEEDADVQDEDEDLEDEA